MEVITPSGLRGRVRKLRGTEANVLADRKLGRKGETFDRILEGCWVETIDPGPYDFEPGTAKVPWSKVLVCDRFVTLVSIRIATYGSDFVFQAHCDDNGHGCGARFEWEIDLVNDLPLYDLPEESRKKIEAKDNRFECEIDGKRYVFKLQTGADERRAGKGLADRRDEMMTYAIESRIVEIEGVEKRKIGDHLKSLDLDLQLQLLDAFEAVDGGFDTQIEIECPKCDSVIDVQLPFEGAPFWLPRSRSRKKSDAGRGRKRTLGSATKDEEPEEI